MNQKATIHDYARMCKKYVTDCESCPLAAKLNGENMDCQTLVLDCPGKANEIILKWCEEHPVVTRQDRFLKIFPKAKTNTEGRIAICPNSVEYDYMRGCANVSCPQCMDKYWLAEVDKNE